MWRGRKKNKNTPAPPVGGFLLVSLGSFAYERPGVVIGPAKFYGTRESRT